MALQAIKKLNPYWQLFFGNLIKIINVVQKQPQEVSL